ncbi:MAG: hypothetical protein V4503_04960 [Gemmatimonadota bacterium]
MPAILPRQLPALRALLVTTGFLFAGGPITQLAEGLSLGSAIVSIPRAGRSKGAAIFSAWLVVSAISTVVGTYAVSRGIHTNQIYQWYRLLTVILLTAVCVRMVADPRPRQLIIGVAVAYLLLWLAAVLRLEAGAPFSNFSYPATQAVGLLVGILLVRQALRRDDLLPFRQAETWLGIGLILACSTGMIRNPLLAIAGPDHRALSGKIYHLTGLFNDVSLILYCIAFWARSIIWTR